ncbi:MAG: YafY family protein [Anaerolineae bacterium]
MNRTDRLLAIVLVLQANGWQRAEDLAAHFEISKRTVYRDMLALMESGVPVISQPGLGYTLDEGYFLPPLHFTPDEAIMLILGAASIAQNFDEVYRRAAQSSAAKIEAVLGESQREAVTYLKNSLRFVSLNTVEDPTLTDVLQRIRRAILQRKTVRLEYQKRYAESEEGRVREVDPHALVHFGNGWYMSAYCHLRQSMRMFRLGRIDRLTILPETFDRQPNFDVNATPPREVNVTVKAVFDSSMARWVTEERSFYLLEHELRPDGFYVTLGARFEDELLRWLLGWGSKVCVLEPESMKVRLRERASQIAALYPADS